MSYIRIVIITAELMARYNKMIRVLIPFHGSKEEKTLIKQPAGSRSTSWDVIPPPLVDLPVPAGSFPPNFDGGLETSPETSSSASLPRPTTSISCPEAAEWARSIHQSTQ
ncbi:hypothetical protein X777_12005, partial [Ooceraea biroi]